MCTRALHFGVGCGGRVSGNVTLGRVVVDANVTVDVGGAFDSLELVSGAAFALRGGGVVKLQSLVVNQNATLVVGANTIFNVVASGSGVTNDGIIRLNDTLVVRGSFNQVCRPSGSERLALIVTSQTRNGALVVKPASGVVPLAVDTLLALDGVGSSLRRERRRLCRMAHTPTAAQCARHRSAASCARSTRW